MKPSLRRIGIVLILIILVIVVALVINRNTTKRDSTLIIILSPHFDDAVLSLGGMMAKEEHPMIVATFFTEIPEIATSTGWDKAAGFSSSNEVLNKRTEENVQALSYFKGVTPKEYSYLDNQYIRKETDDETEIELAKDIQSLIASAQAEHVSVYGPAYFNQDITHPDHGLLHKAFIDVARSYPTSTVDFFVYEDYPYVERFMGESVVSLQKNLENTTELFFTKIQIPLTAQNISRKITSLRKYTSQVKAFAHLNTDILANAKRFSETRCGTNPEIACEVVYKIATH
jgi:LmbE family N-acetylglucosaminyl deacetylase